MLIECYFSATKYQTRYRLTVDQGIGGHLTADVLSIHDPHQPAPVYWAQVSMPAVYTHYLEWSLNIFSGTVYSYRLRTV